jgi:hypothetical protein
VFRDGRSTLPGKDFPDHRLAQPRDTSSDLTDQILPLPPAATNSPLLITPEVLKIARDRQTETGRQGDLNLAALVTLLTARQAGRCKIRPD